MINILIIDNDPVFATKLQSFLKNLNFNADTAFTSLEGLESYAIHNHQLVVIDFDLKSISGIKLVASLKRINPDLKTILYSSVVNEERELEALDVGVDMFWDKEKSLNVFSRYLELMFANYYDPSLQQTLYSKSENMLVDVVNQTVTKDAVEYILTPTEIDILTMFLANIGKVLSREDIIAGVWDESYSEDLERKVDVHVRNIRKKLKITAIHTLRGKGYRWSEQS